MIVATTVLAGVAAVALAFLGSKRYDTTAELLFNQTIPTELNALGLLPPAPNADKLAADNAAFVSSRRVAIRAAQLLGDGTSVDSVQNHVSVPIPKASDVVDITANADSRARVAKLANAYATAAIQIARGDQATRTAAIVDGLKAQVRKLSPTDPAIPGIHQRIATLGALGSSGTGVPRLIQAGFAPTHSSGNPLATVALGILFGLLLGLALALIREQTDARLRHPRAVSAAFDAPVLTSVPNNRSLGRGLPFASLPPDAAAAFYGVLAHLRYGGHTPVRSLLITSTGPRQGKTTIAWNLAGAAAASGLSVVLVDADLRGSTLAADYGLEPEPGVMDVLRGDASLADALQRIPTSENGALNGHRQRAAVLTAGSPSTEPMMVLQSAEMADLLRVLRQYELVVIDASSITQQSDAIALLRGVEGVLIAAPLGASRGSEAEQLRTQLQALDARVIGVIATGGGKQTSGYVDAGRPTQAFQL